MNEMIITDVRHLEDGEGVLAIIDGVTMVIPLNPANRHYAEIMRQIEAGELTIADAD